MRGPAYADLSRLLLASEENAPLVNFRYFGLSHASARAYELPRRLHGLTAGFGTYGVMPAALQTDKACADCAGVRFAAKNGAVGLAALMVVAALNSDLPAGTRQLSPYIV